MTLSMADLLEALKAVAEPTRLRLVAICAEGELTVSEIARILDQSQPRVSRHLKVLCDAGLLIRFRERHWVFYRVPAKGAGAELARRVLSLIDADDERLALVRTRMGEVKSERARAAADYLRFHADDWARLLEASVSAARINEAIVGLLGERSLGDVLDIGTGTGRILRLLGPRADSAVGVDISTDMLQVARSNLHAAGLGHVMVRQANMYRLPFEDASFDTVTLDQVLYLADEPAAAVAEAARILRPGGQLLVVDLAPFGPGHRGSAVTGAGVTRIGVSDSQLESWCQRVGLQNHATTHLNGDELTVVLSVAIRERRGASAAA